MFGFEKTQRIEETLNSKNKDSFQKQELNMPF